MSSNDSYDALRDVTVSVVLPAGGTGLRMGVPTPKQVRALRCPGLDLCPMRSL